jgi:3-methyladenine DNA glycosylase AlkD
MHKAVGWMLREMGKKDEKTLINFLDKNYNELPRTALRYSIERLSVDKKKKYMSRN